MHSIVGKTLRFTFQDGPMAGKAIDHTFEPAGAVRFRMAGSEGAGTVEKKYEAAAIGPDVSAVSYLSSSGYTLTVVLDYRTKSLVAFSSNATTHLMQRGTFEERADTRASSAAHG